MQNLGKYYSSFKGRDTNLCKKESKIISCILKLTVKLTSLT